MVGAGHGRGMASVNQTRPRCVNQMGKTHSEPLAAQHGRGTAWAQHAMCESAFTASSSFSRHVPQQSESALIRAKDLVTGASHTCRKEYAIVTKNGILYYSILRQIFKALDRRSVYTQFRHCR